MPTIQSGLLPTSFITIPQTTDLDPQDVSPENCYKQLQSALDAMKEYWQQQGYKDLRFADDYAKNEKIDPHQEIPIEIQLPEGAWVRVSTLDPLEASENGKDQLKAIDELVLVMLRDIMVYTLTQAFTDEKKERAQHFLDHITQNGSSWRQRCAAYDNAMDALEDPLDLGLFRQILSLQYTMVLVQLLDEAREKESLGDDVEGADYLAVCEMLFGTILGQLFSKECDNPLEFILTLKEADTKYRPLVDFLEDQGKALFPDEFETDAKERVELFRKDLEALKNKLASISSR